MAVIAITRILHGAEDGTVKTFEIGDTLSLPEEELRALVQGGSAVETGKDRKYASPLTTTAVSDDDTRKRDEIIAKSQSEAGNEGGPPSPADAGAPTEEQATRQLREKQDAEAKANAKTNK